MKKITFFQLDRVWYEVENRQVIGDMYFTFQLSDEVRSLKSQDLIKYMLECVRDYEIDSDYNYNDREQVPIYEVHKHVCYVSDDFEVNDDDDLLNIFAPNRTYKKLVDSFAICDKGYGDRIGLTEYFSKQNQSLHYIRRKKH